MRLTLTRDDIENEILRTIDKMQSKRMYLRIVLTRGAGEISLDPKMAKENNLIIIAKELPENPSWWYEKGVHVIVADTIRTSIKSVDPSAKSGNYLNNVMAYEEATKIGAFEAVMLNHDGMVTEATTSNIWIVKDGKVMTPPLKAGLLGGITRKKLIEVAKKHNIFVYQENFTAKELRLADECFITSTTKQLVPVTKIDDTPVGEGNPGDMTMKLLTLYRKELGIH